MTALTNTVAEVLGTDLMARAQAQEGAPTVHDMAAHVLDAVGLDQPLPADVGIEAQMAAEAHLAACWEWYDEFEMLQAENGSVPESPASGPFCGCQTCCVRETLHAVWPVFERYAQAAQ